MKYQNKHRQCVNKTTKNTLERYDAAGMAPVCVIPELISRDREREKRKNILKMVLFVQRRYHILFVNIYNVNIDLLEVPFVYVLQDCQYFVSILHNNKYYSSKYIL